MPDSSSTSPHGIDNRRFERKKFRSAAWLILPGHPPFKVGGHDISAGGVSVVASVNAPAGATCTIRLMITTRKDPLATFEVPVRVVHSIFANRENGFVVGLQFTKISRELAAAISEFMAN